LLPYKSLNVTGLLGVQDPDGYYHSVRVINAVIGYNTKQVKKEDAPRKFSDLTDPKWKDRVGMPDPTLSGSAFDTVAALAGKYGWDYYKGLRRNKVFVADGQGALEKKLITGEVAVATILETNILIAKSKGEPVDLVYPDDGVGVFPSPIGIMSTTRNTVAAKAMVDWWVTREGQEAMASGFMHSVRKDVAPPPGAAPLSQLMANALPMDWEQLAGKIGELKDEWNQAMKD
jgi:iron(III) transport system substrate-binding protein